MSNKMSELALEMIKIKKELDRLKAQTTILYNRFEQIRKNELPEAMEEMGIQNVNLLGIGKLSMRTDAYCTVLTKNREAMLQWMRENGHEDLVKETINGSTLKAWMKEQILSGNEVPDELVNFSPYTYVAITKN